MTMRGPDGDVVLKNLHAMDKSLMAMVEGVQRRIVYLRLFCFDSQVDPIVFSSTTLANSGCRYVRSRFNSTNWEKPCRDRSCRFMVFAADDLVAVAVN